MYSRQNVEFNGGDVTLKGWFYTPTEITSRVPCIIMTHGFSALKEHYLDKFAAHFANNGMCVLVYDNRNFGESGGLPRLEVDPTSQMSDMKSAITYVQELQVVDPKRIGLWGTSFSAGVVLAVAATDKRVACVVAQVPFVSGHHKILQSKKPEQWQAIKEKYDADRKARSEGSEPVTMRVVTDDPDKSAIMKIPSAYTFFTSVESWQNKVTLRSIENSGEFQPINYVQEISPIPLLFIVGKNDTINSTDLALKAYEKALEPKKLVLIEGDHFEPYINQFDVAVTTACSWYKTHLLAKEVA